MEQEVVRPSPPGSPYTPHLWPSCFISRTPNPLSSAAASLSLSLSFSTTAPPPPLSVSCFPLSSRCCRSAPIGGTWPQPAQAAARLGGGRAATSPVGAGEHVHTGELRLLVPLPLSSGESPVGSLSLSLRRALFLPRTPSLSVFPAFPILLTCFPAAQNRGLPVRRVVCCGVPRGVPWRLSDDKATPWKHCIRRYPYPTPNPKKKLSVFVSIYVITIRIRSSFIPSTKAPSSFLKTISRTSNDSSNPASFNIRQSFDTWENHNMLR